MWGFTALFGCCFFGGFLFFFSLQKVGLAFAVPLVSSFVLVNIQKRAQTKWIKWAFANVDNVDELLKRAIAAKLLNENHEFIKNLDRAAPFMKQQLEPGGHEADNEPCAQIPTSDNYEIDFKFLAEKAYHIDPVECQQFAEKTEYKANITANAVLFLVGLFVGSFFFHADCCNTNACKGIWR